MKVMEATKEKENCWEFTKFGREAGGAHVSDLGICPVSVENRLHGTHGGIKAGRSCWVIAGTLCEGKPGIICEEI